jgi:nucleotide-binding universal stress UspA family protein
MPPRLAIAYDGSPSAAAAIQAAATLFPGAEAFVVTVPRPVNMELVAVPAVSPAVLQEALGEIESEALQEAATTALEGVEQARAAGLKAEHAPAPARGPIWATLLELAREHAADALVCGTRGRGGFARALLGSVSSGLLHHADIPLLAVPDEAGQLDGPAFVGYDGSADAGSAIEAAGRLLDGRDTVIVHVWESQFRHGLTNRALSQVERIREIVQVLDESLSERAQAVVQDGVARARAAGLDATGEALESTEGVWRTVAAAARSRRAAVIVAGARGVGEARSALLGSVSSGLLHNAERPVLVVPPAERG